MSPEYGPLPFVKKLKILNERQKLEELEIAMKTRSFSLDIPETQTETGETLTRLLTLLPNLFFNPKIYLCRSHSEGSSVHQQDQRANKQFLTAPLTSSPLHSSNESNETLERRNLKSILKKLSEDTKEKTQDNSDKNSPELISRKMDSNEFKRCLVNLVEMLY